MFRICSGNHYCKQNKENREEIKIISVIDEFDDTDIKILEPL